MGTGKLTAVLVPLMGAFFFLAACGLILCHVQRLPVVLLEIFRGALSDTDSVWKNAIALYVMPSRRVSLNIYGALHSAFGLYDEVSESVDESSVDWVSAIETGGGVSFFIPGSSVVMNVFGFSFILPSSPAYIGCKVCINYLF